MCWAITHNTCSCCTKNNPTTLYENSSLARWTTYIFGNTETYFSFNATDDSWAPLQDDLGLNNQSYWGTLSLATDATEVSSLFQKILLLTHSRTSFNSLFPLDFPTVFSITAQTRIPRHRALHELRRRPRCRLVLGHVRKRRLVDGGDVARRPTGWKRRREERGRAPCYRPCE